MTVLVGLRPVDRRFETSRCSADLDVGAGRRKIMGTWRVKFRPWSRFKAPAKGGVVSGVDGALSAGADFTPLELGDASDAIAHGS